MIVLSASGLVVEDGSCCFCCCSVACRCCCCSVACCCCCGSFGEVGFGVSVVGGCCPFISCCLGGGSLIIISRTSFSAGDGIRSCSFAHLVAVAEVPSSGLAADGLLDLLASSILHLQERSHLSSVWTFQLSSFRSSWSRPLQSLPSDICVCTGLRS